MLKELNMSKCYQFETHGYRFFINYVDNQWELASFPAVMDFKPETLRVYREALNCLQAELDRKNQKSG